MSPSPYKQKKMSNKEILTAILIEWMKPVLPAMLESKVRNIPVLSMFENWVKKTGIAPANWTVMQDIAPLIQRAAYDIIAPIVEAKMKGLPDEALPQMAHGIVDAAIENGGMQLLGGNITFDKEDMQELKNYLNYNLPYKKKERYTVLKSMPEAAGDEE